MTSLRSATIGLAVLLCLAVLPAQSFAQRPAGAGGQQNLYGAIAEGKEVATVHGEGCTLGDTDAEMVRLSRDRRDEGATAIVGEFTQQQDGVREVWAELRLAC